MQCNNCGNPIIDENYAFDEKTYKEYCDLQCVEEDLLHEPTNMLQHYMDMFIIHE